MPYLILVTIVWAFSFSLISQYLAGRVDSDFAVLMRVAIAALRVYPFHPLAQPALAAARRLLRRLCRLCNLF